MKKSLIIVIALVISIISIGILVINKINETVEEVIVKVLNDEMNQSPFKFKDVSISATKGLMTISEIEYVDEDIIMNMDSIDLELSVGNAINIIKEFNNANITDLKVTIKNMDIKDHIGSIHIEQDQLSANLSGNMNTKIFNEDYISKDSDFTITNIKMKNDGVTLSSELGEMEFEQISFELNGNIKASDLEKDYKETGYISIKDILDDVFLDIEDFQYNPAQQLKQGLTMMSYMFLGNVSLIGNQENWGIDKLSLQTGVLGDTITVDKLDLLTNWIDLSVNGSVTVDELMESFTPLNIRLNINDYMKDLRPVLEMLTANLTNETIPEGSFTLNLSLEDDKSYPQVVVEKN